MCPRPLAAVLVTVAVIASTAAFAAPRTRATPQAPVDAELERPPSWTIPSAERIRTWMLEWIDRRTAAATAPPEAVAAVRDAWSRSGSDEALANEAPADSARQGATRSDDARPDVLDRVMESFARLDERCGVIWRAARGDGDANAASAAVPAAPDWLTAADTDIFQRDAVRLWLGRELVRHDRFDEGLAVLAELDPATAVDPAALLFHRAACQHWLLESDLAVETLDRLLERAGDIPVRYERVARLLRADITSLEDESLDHIARRMKDVSRRLGLGRAGPKTVALQDGVIESLDKLIKAIEQQQQQQQQQQAASGAGGAGRGGDGAPMDDSRIAGGKGPGEVTKKDLGDTDGWGKLPPHEREEALQQIGREFPAHYREAIEQYFKRLASGEEKR